MQTKRRFLTIALVLFCNSASLAAGYSTGYQAPGSPGPVVQAATQVATAPATTSRPPARRLDAIYHAAWLKLNDSFHDPRALDDWKTWEHKFDGKLNTPSDLDNAIEEMVTSLNDRWTSYISYVEQAHAARRAMYGGGHIGMHLKRAEGGFRIEMISYGSPAYKSKLREGDLVVSLNGQDLSGMPQEEVDMMLWGMAGSRLVVQTAELPGRIELAFQQSAKAAVQGRIIDGDVLYIRFPDFESASRVSEFAEEFARLNEMTGRKARGLVLDLRNNPGGIVDFAEQMASLTLPEGALVAHYIERRQGLTRVTHVRTTREITVNDRPIEASVVEQLRQLRIVVLANGSTASAAELLIQALRANGRATIVGTQTFGKGLGYTVSQLPNGGVLTVATLTNLGPNMRSHNLTGIAPDRMVEQDRDSKDRQLDAAVETLRSPAPTQS